MDTIKRRLLNQTQEGFDKLTKSNESVEESRNEPSLKFASQSPQREVAKSKRNIMFPQIPSPMQMFNSPERSPNGRTLERKSNMGMSFDNSKVRLQENLPQNPSPTNSPAKTFSMRKRSRSNLPPK